MEILKGKFNHPSTKATTGKLTIACAGLGPCSSVKVLEDERSLASQVSLKDLPYRMRMKPYIIEINLVIIFIIKWKRLSAI